MSRTPSKSNDTPSPLYENNFIPKELPSTKDDHGIARTVFTHVSRLHSLLLDWINIQNKGTKICKSILALKLHECTDDYYPQALTPLTQGLVEALESLKHIIEGVETIKNQLEALSKLESTNEPLICTWPVMKISEAVGDLFKALQKECQLKVEVTENIAHCRDENLLEVYASVWEFDPYLDLQNSVAYLFAEVGLPGI